MFSELKWADGLFELARRPDEDVQDSCVDYWLGPVQPEGLKFDECYHTNSTNLERADNAIQA